MIDRRNKILEQIVKRRIKTTEISKHPNTIQQFLEYKDNENFDGYYLDMVSDIESGIMKNKMSFWKEMYAIGPFFKQKRRFKMIPLFLFADYRNELLQIIRLSELLTPFYVQYRIMPQFNINHHRSEKRIKNDRNWKIIEAYSIKIF